MHVVQWWVNPSCNDKRFYIHMYIKQLVTSEGVLESSNFDFD
jgi:hypothetical protein